MDDYIINRTDGSGRSIYLQNRPASAPTVIFTGPPGMGKTYAVGKAVDAARDNGDLVLTIDAGSREPLEKRLARAVNDQFDDLAATTNGDRVLRDLGRVVDNVLGDRFKWAEKAAAALGPLLRKAISWWEAPARPTLTDLTERLTAVAEKQNKKLLLAIDNLDPAKQSDLKAVAELADHLATGGGPGQLVVGASAPAVDALLSTGSAVDPTKIADRYDIRECSPIPEAELKAALVADLHRQGAAVQADAVTRLVHEANGDPGHLRSLAGRAATLADPARGVNRAVAEETIRAVRDADQWAYRAGWSRLSDDARVIVLSAIDQPREAASGQPPIPSGPQELVERGRLIASLVDSGILRRTGDKLTIGDPGFQHWVTATIAPAAAPSPAPAAERATRSTERPNRSQTTTPAGRPGGTARPGRAPKPGRAASAVPEAAAARRRTPAAGSRTRGAGRG
ncbi:hypothetical protein GCM10011575_28390 [Microlunatus endophyticus]|uniref:Orc1-like AAA ATPase domain-containing protein n=1 Tax=Microlunatus endophyticus TaxID=1716077 RepID=A0A917SBT1_9ACTN|nr:ATP-binding protein [Microlunatus endophyticus]GGL68179.1 hypothetical protein GCM10011575_28390 [Microlunatus endophyticus]